MTIYWAVFLSAAVFALGRLRISPLGWFLIGVGLTVFIGLRYQVGADWGSYIDYLVRMQGTPFYEALLLKDPGYQILNWVSASLGLAVWFVNLVAAGVFVFGLIKFVRVLPDPRIALAVSIPYMVIVMAMGYTRQAMAFGFVLWGLTYLIERRILAFILLLSIAAAFHKSAVVLIPLAVLANTRNRWWTAVWVGVAGAVLFATFVQSYVDTLYQTYVASSYANASEGGPIRTLMNALPGLVFIAFRKRLNMPAEERALWFWISVFSLLCLPLLLVSATAVDRVALYFMPIQLVVASYFPSFFRSESRVISRIAVLGFYGAVLFVWLNYAAHNNSWLPYQFWLTA